MFQKPAAPTLPEKITAHLRVMRIDTDAKSKSHQYKFSIAHRSHNDNESRLKTLLDTYAMAHATTVHDENGAYVAVFESKSLDVLLQTMRRDALKMQIDLNIAQILPKTDIALEIRTIVTLPNDTNAYNISVCHKHMNPNERPLLLKYLKHYAKLRNGAALNDDGSKFSFNTEIMGQNIFAPLLRSIREDLSKFFTVEILREQASLSRPASLQDLHEVAERIRTASDADSIRERRRSSLTSPPPLPQALARAGTVSPRGYDPEFSAPPMLLLRSASAVAYDTTVGSDFESTRTNTSAFVRPNRDFKLG